MPGYRIISSDSHIVEPADLWTSRIESTYRERAPQLIREGNSDMWYSDGEKLMGVTVGSQPGVRFEDQEKMKNTAVFEEIRPGAYNPDEHVKDMEIDGVEASVIYPSMGLFLFTVQDSQLLDAIFRVYNSWLSEFCNAHPKLLNGIAMINVDDPALAGKELERCNSIGGLSGSMITCYLPWGGSYSDPKFDVLWATAQDLGMPLSLHAATNRPARGQPITHGDPRDPRPAHQANRDHWVRECLSDIIFDGVLERFPKLQVGAVEFEVSWVPHFLDRIDYTYTQRSIKPSWHRYNEDMLPSDYFHRNVFVGFQEDGLGIRLRDIVGVDNLQWGSDYPHSEGTFPRSREILGEILSDCSDEEKAKIAGDNAARIYHLN